MTRHDSRPGDDAGNAARNAALAQLFAIARRLLGGALGKCPTRIHVDISSHTARLRLSSKKPDSVSHVSAEEGASQDTMNQLAQAFFSPVERDVVRLLSAHGPLITKEIAARLHVSNSGGFRAILANLVERGVLSSSNAEGYSVRHPIFTQIATDQAFSINGHGEVSPES